MSEERDREAEKVWASIGWDPEENYHLYRAAFIKAFNGGWDVCEEHYDSVLDEVSGCYYQLTNGKFSKPNTRKEVIIDEVEALHQEDLEELQKDYDQLWKEAEKIRIERDELREKLMNKEKAR
jgi:regulator of replication initiation timing